MESETFLIPTFLRLLKEKAARELCLRVSVGKETEIREREENKALQGKLREPIDPREI